MSGPREAYVIAARRTPIGRVGGVLRHLRVEQLVAPLITAVLDDLGATAEMVDDLVLGNVWGPGGNPARVALLTAGVDPRVPGVTIDRQCASGLEAINLAARLVAASAADLVLAGGAESVSTAPWRVDKPASLYQLPSFHGRARFAPDGIGDPDMGPAADELARRHGVDRARQDAFALRSHRNALAAAASGRFDAELVALPAPGAADESPRPRLSERALAGMRPVFTPDGTVTAGNASPVNDGAALVAVASGPMRERLGVAHALRFVDGVAAGVEPTLPGSGPIAAVRRLLAAHPTVAVEDLEVVEFTEAFAGQTLACLDALSIDEDRVNLGGGAIALGHPWGASGAVLVTRLFTELVRAPRGATAPAHGQPRYGLATLAGAGGVGVATLLEAC